jgi:hypothetical protein
MTTATLLLALTATPLAALARHLLARADSAVSRWLCPLLGGDL